jgi:hypothetical protein
VSRPTRGSTRGLGSSIWRLLKSRQHLLGFLAALAIADAALLVPVLAALDRLTSWTTVARGAFSPDTWHEAMVAAQNGSLETAGALALLVVGDAFLTGWLRGAFLLGLAGDPVTLRPPRDVFLRLAAYTALADVVLLVGARIGGGGGDVVHLAAAFAFLYADYAIVVDRVPVAEAFRRSWRALRRLPGPSILLVLAGVVASSVVYGIFHSGFVDARYVQPTYLLAWLLAGALVIFVLDAAGLTLYRSVSAGADADRP